MMMWSEDGDLCIVYFELEFYGWVSLVLFIFWFLNIIINKRYNLDLILCVI